MPSADDRLSIRFSCFSKMKFFRLLAVLLVAQVHSLSSALVSGQARVWPQCEEASTCTGTFPYCPDCSVVDCLQKVYPEDCPKGTAYEENVLWGCCPACVKYLKDGDACEPGNAYEHASLYDSELGCWVNGREKVRLSAAEKTGIPIVERFVCGPDCRQTCKSACELLTKPDAYCSHQQRDYINWMQNTTHKCEYNEWNRNCRVNGDFDLVQSKGNDWTVQATKKFCSGPSGQRLDGTGLVSDETMNCLCSRKDWDLNTLMQEGKSDRVDVTLHCQFNGNFEELQCDEGLCWCVDPAKGTVTTGVVHKDLVKLLKCFKKETFGETYLRRCESRLNGKAYSRKIFARHGLAWPELDESYMSCNNEGGFGPISCEPQASCKCVDKMNQAIKEFAVPSQEANTLDCRCARDSWENSQYGWADTSPIFVCNEKGGYRPLQTFGSKDVCVDGDGFETTARYPRNCMIQDCKDGGDPCVPACPEKP